MGTRATIEREVLAHARRVDAAGSPFRVSIRGRGLPLNATKLQWTRLFTPAPTTVEVYIGDCTMELDDDDRPQQVKNGIDSLVQRN